MLQSNVFTQVEMLNSIDIDELTEYVQTTDEKCLVIQLGKTLSHLRRTNGLMSSDLTKMTGINPLLLQAVELGFGSSSTAESVLRIVADAILAKQ